MRNCLVLLFSLIMVTFNAHAAPVAMSLCYSIGANPPYMNGDGNIVPPPDQRGYFVDSATRSAIIAGLELTLIRLPWKRCISSVEAGKIDGFIGAIRTPERDRFLRYPMQNGEVNTKLSLSSVHYHFFENINNPLKWQKGKKFPAPNQLIGAPRGFIITQKLKEHGLNVIENLSNLSGIEKVAKGQLQGYAIAREVVPHLLKIIPQGAENIHRVDPAFMISHLFIPIHKTFYDRHPEQVEKFWVEIPKHLY